MAIMDAQLELCDNDSVFSNGSTVVSENVINWGDADLEIGIGQPLYLNIVVSTAFSGGTSAQFKIVGNSTATVTGGTVVVETGAIAVGTLVQGYKVLRVQLPANVDENQFIGIDVTCVGNVTAGAIDAWIDLGPQSSHDVQVAQS